MDLRVEEKNNNNKHFITLTFKESNNIFHHISLKENVCIRTPNFTLELNS